MGRLDGKVALITGGANGMGAAEARMFAREGARVVIGDLMEQEGQRVEAEIREGGGEAMFVLLDVTSEQDWQRAVDSIVARFGKLDVLVNNAGISSRSFPDPDSIDGWDRIMDVNSKGVFLGTRHAVPEMLKAGGGSIVNISSIAGMVGLEGGHPAYNASKGAVRIFTKNTALRYAKEGIRANSIHPGFMPPMTSSVQVDPDQRDRNIGMTPMARRGELDEVAYAVLFLASDEASFITGAELAVDGGYTAR